MTFVYDNNVVFYISSNMVFYERAKYIEIDCHFICEKIVSVDIKTKFVNSKYQLAYITPNLYIDLELVIFVTSLIHTIYMY